MSSLNCRISRHLLLHARRRFKATVARSRSYCASEQPLELPDHDFVPFHQLLASRREEALRSIIVQVKNENSSRDLLSYCSNFGALKDAFYYSVSQGDSRNNFILVEFENAAHAQAALCKSSHSSKECIVPVQSPFLWFRSDLRPPQVKSDLPDLKVQPIAPPSDSELLKSFSQTNSFSEDVILLYNSLKLSDLATRLRFICALQLENAFKGMFPSSKVLPFGSSVNGFGKINSDLDLIHELHTQCTDSRLVFHSKSLFGTSKAHNQRHLETIADVVQYFLPGCTNTRRILRARVPIIRYKQEITGIVANVNEYDLFIKYHPSPLVSK